MKCVSCYYDWNCSKLIKERGISWFLELKKIKKNDSQNYKSPNDYLVSLLLVGSSNIDKKLNKKGKIDRPIPK